MHLEIVTPKGKLLAKQVDELTAPGVLGEFGVLPGHIPFVSGIRPGVVRYRSGGEHGSIAVGPGFLEVAPGDRVVLLAQEGALADEIDVPATREELKAAQAELDAFDGSDPAARSVLETKRDWAQAQLDAATASH